MKPTELAVSECFVEEIFSRPCQVNRIESTLLSMSSISTPIPLHRFAEALPDLPLSNLHFKAAELRNSIAHLQSSNQQLGPFAADGDEDCASVIKENMEVISRMESRIFLLKHEVEHRGFKWGDEDQQRMVLQANGATEGDGTDAQQNAHREPTSGEEGRGIGGTIGDEELTRRLRDQTGEGVEREDDDEEERNGIHL